jgi:hypothetical protein
VASILLLDGLGKVFPRRMEWLESCLPNRVAKEELGDLLEQVAIWRDQKRPRIEIWLRSGAGMGWLVANGVREYVAQILQRVAGR